MYSNKSYFIFGFGAGNIWIIMKLEHIWELLKKKVICLVWIFLFFMGEQSNWDFDNKYIWALQL